MALGPHIAFTVAFLISIVPAITILYYTLKNFERYLNDRFLFFSILMGLFFGILVSVFHLVISAEESLILSLFTFFMIILSFALFENLVKVVFVQLKRFGTKFDTTYYGATFGIIIGASITMGRTYSVFVKDLQWYQIVGIFIFSLAMIFMNGATGAWLGLGCHKRDLRWTMLTNVMLCIPFNFFVFLWYLFPIALGSSPDELMLIVLALFYALIVFMYVYFRILPEALPLKYRRELIRTARKLAQRR